MKTIRIICSIAVSALAGICFAQPLAQNNKEVLNDASFYSLASNRVEHRANPYPARSTYGDYFEAPPVSQRFFAPNEISFHEDEIQLESWMLSPFEISFYEPDLVVEEWMTRPFETEPVLDEEIEVEEWMTRPFETDPEPGEGKEIEDRMNSPI